MTRDQRVRAATLVAFMVAFSGAGVAARFDREPQPLAPCAQPAMKKGVLVCDGRGAPAKTRAWLAGRTLDVNEASALDLEKIPGVGPSLAHAIVAERARRGGRFEAFTDLDDVPGIGPKTLTKLERWLSVAPAPPVSVTGARDLP
jgi:competence ComEA-like helix-hairpin-helix protein